MSPSRETTIAALSTPPGVGGIAVLRVSGPRALHIASSLTKKPASAFKDRHAVFSVIYDSTHTEIDQGVLLFFKGPGSYTGEDVIEISTHGGDVIPRAVLDSCFHHGCRPARPGEFTKRAFLNGKIDLTQAEAVADIISAKTTLSHRFSYKIMSGKFSSLINKMRDDLFCLLSAVEAELDFPDDEVTPVSGETKNTLLSSVLHRVDQLLSTYSTGRLLTHGAVVAIIGSPNVGKSSLLNALLCEERVIVTDLPGTTRDAVEVFYQIDGFPVTFVDTAGLRPPSDPIEAQGLNFSHKYIQKSDLILWVFAVTDPADRIVAEVSSAQFCQPVITVINKTDLLAPSALQEYHHHLNGVLPVYTSALHRDGLDDLLHATSEALGVASTTDQEIVLTSRRHKNALEHSRGSLIRAKDLIASHASLDVLAFELRDAMSQLDAILGITTADDILNNIFSRFCIGK